MTSELGVACYAVFAVLALVGPGLVLQRRLGLVPDPVLVLPLGTAVAALVSWLSLVSGRPWLFPAVVLLIDATLLIEVGRRRGLQVSPFPWRVLLAPGTVLVVLLAATQYRFNRLGPGG